MPATFLYEAPIVALLAIEPSTGIPAGGTAVVITGRGFQAGATVDFDGAPATAVVVVSSERITCTTPAHAEADVDVVVTNLDANTATLEDGFSYAAVPPPQRVQYRLPSGVSASRVRTETAAPTISLTLGGSGTFTFSAEVEPGGEMPVECRLGGRQLFLGTVTGKIARVDGVDRLEVWDTTATDLSHRLSRRKAWGSWTATPADTIITALMAAHAPGFTAIVEGGLPAITVKLDGRQDLWTALNDVCKRAGAKMVLAGTTLRVFTVDSGWDPPAVVTESNPDLEWTEPAPPVTLDWDYLGIVNSVRVVGAAGLETTVDDAASIAAFDVTEDTIDDDTLTTLEELRAAGQARLAAAAWPIPVAKYVTRDPATYIGKTVTLAIARPAISGVFVIQTVTIDQFDVIEQGKNPRFTVTAKPAAATMRSGGLDVLLETVVDLAAAAAKQPRLTGDVVSEPGGRTTIPPDSITAAQLAGCIPTDLLQPGPVKDPVVTATEGALTRSGLSTIAGRAVVAGDRVLVKDQADPSENGIYIAAAGAWTRATDADDAAQLPAGILVAVQDGTQAGTVYLLLAPAPVVVDATALTFVPLSGATTSAAPPALIRIEGADGADGWPGPPGLPGAAGATGATGTVGAIGPPGRDGEDGGDAWPQGQTTGDIRADGSLPFLADQSMGGHQLTSLATPTVSTDAATKGYVDGLLGDISASVYRATNQTLTHATEVAITLSTAQFDTDTLWAGGAPTRLTVVHAGKYFVRGQIQLGTGFAGTAHVRIYKNGAQVAEGTAAGADLASGAEMHAATWLGDLAATDYLEMKVLLELAAGSGTFDVVGGAAATLMQTFKVAPTSGGGAAGALVLLEEYTVAAQASIDFTTRNAAGQSGASFQTDFDDYIIRFQNLLNATNNQDLQFLIRVAGAFITANYEYVIIDQSTSGAGIASSQSTSAAAILLFPGIDNAQGYGATGWVEFADPLSTTFKKAFGYKLRAPFQSVARRYMAEGAGFYNPAAAAMDGCRLKYASGNISGTARLYGVAK